VILNPTKDSTILLTTLPHPSDTLETAAQLVYQTLQPSPHISWPLLNQRVGTPLWIKHENHLPTGSFKLRGGLVYMARLCQQHPHLTHVVTSTRGNHGQSIALAARQYGLQATIVVPVGNSPCKNMAMQALGAQLLEHGHDVVDAAVFARQWALAHKAAYIESFHPDLVDGVATYSLELLKARPELNVVYVPIGMGSGICGMVKARNLLGLRTRIVGVVAEQAAAYALSFARKTLTATETAHTVADGLACRLPRAEALDIIWQGVDDVVTVTEAEIQHAMAMYFNDTHNVAEGASAAALAAVLKAGPRLAGQTVGVIHTGGNVDGSLLSHILTSAALDAQPLIV
jgi:threonine dehydratase